MSRFRVLVLVLLASPFLSCRKQTPSAQPVLNRHPLDPSRWMEDHLASFGNRSLRQLVLPASHDSAMYRSGFPQSLGRTQTLNIYSQLKLGVRYFDLRPQWRGGTLYLHHDIITGPMLIEVLEDVRQFMNEGHRELIILKFSHYDSFDDDRYKQTTNLIQDRLSPWLVRSKPADKRLADIVLADFVDATGKVLVVCDGSYPIRVHCRGVWVYRDRDSTDAVVGDLRVYDQYSNTISYIQMKADQLAKFDRYDGRCRRAPDLRCDLFLLSWTLTPPTDVLAFAAEPNQKLADEMAKLRVPNRYGCIPNLIYIDDVETSNLATIAVKMNETIFHSR
jgi:hypothetical protein